MPGAAGGTPNGVVHTKWRQVSGNDNFDVIVAGAGPGGSTCAALLAHRGHRVLLIDKNALPGGRMMRQQRDGFTYELFPINGVPSRGSVFAHVIKELALEREIQLITPKVVGSFAFGLPSGDIAHIEMRDSPITAVEMLRKLQIPPRKLVGDVRLMVRLLTMKEPDISALDDVTVHELLTRYNPSHSIYGLLGTLSEGALETPADVACASEFVRIYQQSSRQGSSRYVVGGYGRMFEVFTDVVRRNGGTVRLGEKVHRITVDDGRVTGVETDAGTFRAPAVISNASIPTTVLSLVGREYFDRGYLNYVTDLHPGWGFVGYRAFIPREVLKGYTNIYFSHNTVVTSRQWAEAAKTGIPPKDAYVFVGTNSVYQGMAPAGRQLVYAGMTSPSHPNLDPAPYLARTREIVDRVWPGLLDGAERLESFGPAAVSEVGSASVLPGQGGEVYGLAQTVGQCGRHAPTAKSPVRGLYFVGFSTGQGLGTHGAADSAVKVAREVDRYINVHRDRWQLEQLI